MLRAGTELEPADGSWWFNQSLRLCFRGTLSIGSLHLLFAFELHKCTYQLLVDSNLSTSCWFKKSPQLAYGSPNASSCHLCCHDYCHIVVSLVLPHYCCLTTAAPLLRAVCVAACCHLTTGSVERGFSSAYPKLQINQNLIWFISIAWRFRNLGDEDWISNLFFNWLDFEASCIVSSL